MILRSLEYRFLAIALCDAAEPLQLGSQDAATPMMQGIIDLHHDIFILLIIFVVVVSRMLVRALWHFNEQTNPIPQRIVHGTTIRHTRNPFLEDFWLILVILICLILYEAVQGNGLTTAFCDAPAGAGSSPVPTGTTSPQVHPDPAPQMTPPGVKQAMKKGIVQGCCTGACTCVAATCLHSLCFCFCGNNCF